MSFKDLSVTLQSQALVSFVYLASLHLIISASGSDLGEFSVNVSERATTFQALSHTKTRNHKKVSATVFNQ